ncbi:MAG: hypothetical protein KKC50_08140 [Candidatus Omnitrophica bacterium]|nr:hypothetical protein [Candidatus Omnitrophota bacterium]
MPQSEFAVGRSVCQVCRDPDPLWTEQLDRGAMYMRMAPMVTWLDEQDAVLASQCRETLDRAARIARTLIPAVAALAEPEEPLWTALVEALVCSCHNTVCALLGDPDSSVWVSAPLLWRHKPFRRLRDVLERALDGANLGLGSARPGSSGGAVGVAGPRGMRKTDLLVDIQTAVQEAGLDPLDLGMLVASRVGIVGLDLSRPHCRVRMKNWQIARATELTPGTVRRRLANADAKLTDALVARGLLEEESGGKHHRRLASNS